MWTRLLPFLAWLPGLHRGMLGREAWVGLNGAILALPQSMAYALIAGLPAEYGLYAAMLPVAIACLWGSSRYLVSGPTAAISVLLFSSVAPLAAGQPAIRPGRAAADLSRRRLPVAARRPARRVAGQFRLAFGDARLHPWRGAADHPRPTALSSRPGREREGAAPETAGGCWRGSPSSMAHRCWWAASASRSACWSGACDRAGRPLLLGLLGGATLVWALPGTFASVAHVQALSSALPGWNPLVFDSRSILDLLPAAVACGMLGLVTSLSIARALAARQGTRSMPTRRSAPRACRTCSGLGCRRACRRAPSPAPG